MMRLSIRRCAVIKAAFCLVILGMPATVVAQSTESIEYFHTDAIGSVRMVTGPTGEVLERRDFLPFGEELAPPPNAQPLGFGGAESDVETAASSSLPLNYFGARHLQATSGRFTTVDPGHADGNLIDPQSWNGYAYGRNNPLFFVDPDGRQNCPTNICVRVDGNGRRIPSSEQLNNEGASAEQQLQAERARLDAWDAASVTAGFIPVVGSGQSLVELATGYDYIAGENTSRILAGAGVLAGLFGVKGLLSGSAKGVVHATRNGAFRAAKRAADLPMSRTPRVFYERVYDQPGRVMGRVYEFKRSDGALVQVREHSLGHVKGNHGPHFNLEIRPNGGNAPKITLPPEFEHFYFKR